MIDTKRRGIHLFCEVCGKFKRFVSIGRLDPRECAQEGYNTGVYVTDDRGHGEVFNHW